MLTVDQRPKLGSVFFLLSCCRGVVVKQMSQFSFLREIKFRDKLGFFTKKANFKVIKTENEIPFTASTSKIELNLSVCAPSLQTLSTNQIQRQIQDKDKANDQDIMCLS